MAVFEFTVAGTIEVDADALGVAVANSVRKQPSGEIDVELGFEFRNNPAAALEMLLKMGVIRIMNEKLPQTPWTPHVLDAKAEMSDL